MHPVFLFVASLLAFVVFGLVWAMVTHAVRRMGAERRAARGGAERP
jgi:hypothetical protein